MAVPFSNTRLRVPRGFAALLEGLAREVLRDQPDDIPAYAALHFDGLLKEREESGMDHAEWAAKLEDRFHNNHAFKAGRTSPKVSPVKEPAAEKTTASEEMSSACQTEDDASYPTTSKHSASEHVQRSGDKEEGDDVTEKDVVSTEMERSDNRLTDTDVSADEMSGTEEERGQTITVSDQVDGEADESDSRSAGDNETRHSKLEAAESSSFSGSANVDVEERGTTDDEQGQKKDISVESEEMGDSVKDKQSSELESTEEEVSYSGLADVDVCAAELGIADDERDEIFQKEETHVESQEMRSSMEKSADESADEEVLRRAQELLGNAERDEIFQKEETHVESQEMRSSMEKSADESADEEVLRRAQELLGNAERDEIFQKEETHVESQEMRSSMEKSADESADEEVLRHAQELLGNAEKTLSGVVATDDDPTNVHSSEQEMSMEKMDKISEHSSLSQTEPLETNLQEMEDLAEESLVEEDAKPAPGETQEVSPVDGDPFEGVPETDTEDEPKEEGFVEISFEDVPEIQEKQTDEEFVSAGSQTQLLDVLLTQEASEELPEKEAHDTQDQEEAITEMDTAKKEVTDEAEETTDQHERVDTALEKIDQSDSDSDRSEKKADVIDIIPSCQVTTETEEEVGLVDESHDNQVGGNEEADEIKKEHNEDFKMEETKQETHDPQMKDPNETDVVQKEDIQDTSTQSVGERAETLTNEGGDDSTELNLLQTAPSNLSEPEGEKESETLEANAETLPADSKERETTPVELRQPLDGGGETDERPHKQQVSEEREKVAEETIEAEGRGKDDSVGEKEEVEEAEEEEEGRIIPTQTAEQAEDDSPDNQRPEGSDKDTVTDPQCISNDKEECSRPQEEEDIMDIPLDDPEANKAAAKIQAGFRGHMTRKKIKPENKAEAEEVSSTGEALNCSLMGDAETGGSGTVERDDTSVPEQ